MICLQSSFYLIPLQEFQICLITLEYFFPGILAVVTGSSSSTLVTFDTYPAIDRALWDVSADFNILKLQMLHNC